MNILSEIQALNLAMSRINEMSQKWAKIHNVNLYSIKVMYALLTDESMTQKQICKSCGMPKQTVNNIIKSLHEQNLIVLKTQETDRREKVMSLTEQGKKYLLETLAPFIDLGSRVIQRMGEDNYMLLRKSLTEYSLAMEKEMEETE